jgi:hypothetical protein
MSADPLTMEELIHKLLDAAFRNADAEREADDTRRELMTWVTRIRAKREDEQYEDEQ